MPDFSPPDLLLLQGREENELPEYILGTVRLNRVKPESAVPFSV